MRPRRALVRVHRYCAFLLGAWFVLLGITGSALVFRDELDRWLNPALLSAAGDVDDATIARVHRAARAAFPDAHVERLHVPRVEGEAYRALLRAEARRRVGSPRIEATFAGRDGSLIGTRDPDARSLRREHLLQTVYDLHHRLLLGNAGKDAVGIAGLALFVTVLIGIVLGTPRADRRSLARAFSIKIRAGPARVTYDLHRAIGMAAGALLLVAGATGAMMAYPEYTRDVVGLASKVRPLPAVPWRSGDPATSLAEPDVGRMLAALRSDYPLHRVREIHLPVRPTAPVLVYLHAAGDVHRLGDTLVLLHAVNGDRLVERSALTRTAGEDLMHWLFPLHSGTVFGAPGRWIVFLTGMLPLWLLVSGLVVWWLKRRAQLRASRMQVSVAPTDRAC